MPGVRVGAISAAVAASALALTIVQPAVAKEGDVVVRGTCTKASASKLKLSDEDGRIEVEFEVDQNRIGVSWRVVLKRNGREVFVGRVRTKGPSGSFTLRRLVADGPGADTIAARAVSPGGEVCKARASF